MQNKYLNERYQSRGNLDEITAFINAPDLALAEVIAKDNFERTVKNLGSNHLRTYWAQSYFASTLESTLASTLLPLRTVPTTCPRSRSRRRRGRTGPRPWKRPRAARAKACLCRCAKRWRGRRMGRIWASWCRFSPRSLPRAKPFHRHENGRLRAPFFMAFGRVGGVVNVWKASILDFASCEITLPQAIR